MLTPGRLERYIQRPQKQWSANESMPSQSCGSGPTPSPSSSSAAASATAAATDTTSRAQPILEILPASPSTRKGPHRPFLLLLLRSRRRRRCKLLVPPSDGPGGRRSGGSGGGRRPRTGPLSATLRRSNGLLQQGRRTEICQKKFPYSLPVKFRTHPLRATNVGNRSGFRKCLYDKFSYPACISYHQHLHQAGATSRLSSGGRSPDDFNPAAYSPVPPPGSRRGAITHSSSSSHW